ncbi:MAG TPA: hypothetical protein VLK25_11050 [Allosphingosinicella sp.]|nr:hypothetical protein [Allosphingosinicella sp.]
MLQKVSWFLGALVGLLLLPVILPVMAIRRLFGLHKRKVGPDYLAAILQRAAFGVESEGDWADLKQGPLRDGALEAIRLRAIAFAPPVKLDRAERDALHALMEEAKALPCAQS